MSLVSKSNIDEINEIEIDQWIFVETPMLSAIRNNDLHQVEYLYEQGADIYLFQLNTFYFLNN